MRNPWCLVSALAWLWLGCCPLASLAGPPQSAGEAVLASISNSDQYSPRPAMRVEDFKVEQGASTRPAEAQPIALDLPLRSFRLPRSVEAICISSDRMAAPYTVVAEGPGFSATWKFLPIIRQAPRSEGSLPETQDPIQFWIRLDTALNPPAKFAVPRNVKHLSFRRDAGEVSGFLAVEIVVQNFNYTLQLSDARYGRKSWAFEQAFLSDYKPKDSDPIVQGLLAAGMAKDDAMAAVTRACGALGQLSDEDLLREILAADQGTLRSATDPATAARLAIVLRRGMGYSTDVPTCRMRLPGETFYVTPCSPGQKPEHFGVSGYGPKGQVLLQGMIDINYRRGPIDRQGMLQTLHDMLTRP